MNIVGISECERTMRSLNAMRGFIKAAMSTTPLRPHSVLDSWNGQAADCDAIMLDDVIINVNVSDEPSCSCERMRPSESHQQ